MKTFFIFLIGGLMILLSIVIGIGVASGAEAAKIDDCTYVPKQSDEVRYQCEFTNARGIHKKLVGEGEINVWICGKPYTIEVDCKPKVAQ